MKRISVALVATTVFTLGGSSFALACACCSHVAQRSDYFQNIVALINAQLEQMHFQPKATLQTGERDADDMIPGLTDAVTDYTVTATRLKDRITFALRDAKDRAGTLSLVKPQTISIFEVDP